MGTESGKGAMQPLQETNNFNEKQWTVKNYFANAQWHETAPLLLRPLSYTCPQDCESIAAVLSVC